MPEASHATEEVGGGDACAGAGAAIGADAADAMRKMKAAAGCIPRYEDMQCDFVVGKWVVEVVCCTCRLAGRIDFMWIEKDMGGGGRQMPQKMSNEVLLL